MTNLVPLGERPFKGSDLRPLRQPAGFEWLAKRMPLLLAHDRRRDGNALHFKTRFQVQLASASSPLGHFRYMRAAPADQFVESPVERNLSLEAKIESSSFGRTDTVSY
jgi:hypothetical protein